MKGEGRVEMKTWCSWLICCQTSLSEERADFFALRFWYKVQRYENTPLISFEENILLNVYAHADSSGTGSNCHVVSCC